MCVRTWKQRPALRRTRQGPSNFPGERGANEYDEVDPFVRQALRLLQTSRSFYSEAKGVFVPALVASLDSMLLFQFLEVAALDVIKTQTDNMIIFLWLGTQR